MVLRTLALRTFKSMQEFWETFFSTEGAKWKFDPSDSAIYAAELFQKHKLKTVLIPGVGYGRNAGAFLDKKFNITGIEISESAIKLARASGYTFPIHLGSVTDMPFDDKKFDGVFCYSLIHLLNKNERRIFIKNCFECLAPGGLMVFIMISKESDLYNSGKYISRNRFRIANGLKVFFYDEENIRTEFKDYTVVEIIKIDEPVKYAEGLEPIKCWMVVCKKLN